MRLIRSDTNIDFVGKRGLAMIISLIVLTASVVSIAVQGLALGIDFTGGVVVEVGYPDAVELSEVRAALAEGGYGDAIVQHFGTSSDVLIRLAPREGADSAEVSTQVLDALKQHNQQVEMRRIEFVGPQVGDELKNKGGLALLYALFGILIYVIFRFHWKLAVGSVAALGHDVIITIGVFSVFQLDFDLTVLAALLAVIGYSLNDTIVVYDRVRENFRRMRKADPPEVVNVSVNQMLARTLMTGVTTLLVLFALLFIGGEALEGFSIALIVGIVVGTYSSVYTASAIALWLDVTKEDLFPPKEEEADKHA